MICFYISQTSRKNRKYTLPPLGRCILKFLASSSNRITEIAVFLKPLKIPAASVLLNSPLLPFLPFSVPLSLCFHSIQSSALYPYNAVTRVENGTFYRLSFIFSKYTFTSSSEGRIIWEIFTISSIGSARSGTMIGFIPAL